MTEERELCIKGTSLNATHGPHEDPDLNKHVTHFPK